MRTLLTALIFFSSLYLFGQNQEIDNTHDPIDIDGKVSDPEPKSNPGKEFHDRDWHHNEKNSTSSGKKTQKTKPSTSSSSKYLPLAQIQQQFSTLLDYYDVYFQNPDYIVSRNGKNVNLESLKALNIWSEPQKEMPAISISPTPENLDIDWHKYEFAYEINEIAKKSNDPKVKIIQNKAQYYIGHVRLKDLTRSNNERLFSSNLRSHPIGSKIIYTQSKGNQAFTKMYQRINMGFPTPFKSIEHLTATQQLFNTNIQLSKKVLNPYSNVHKESKNVGINTNQFAIELIRNAQEIIDFSLGFQKGVTQTSLEFFEFGKTTVNYVLKINSIKQVAKETFNLIVSVDPEAFLVSYLRNVYKNIKTLDSGTPFEKGQIIGKLTLGTIFNIVQNKAIERVRYPHYLKKDVNKILDEVRPILNNEKGSFRIGNKEAFRLINNRTLKQVDDLTFSSNQLQRKLNKHGEDFSVKRLSPNNEIPPTPENINTFKTELIKHVKNRATIAISGTYRDINPKPVNIYYNHNTGRIAIFDKDNEFISAWKLSASQKGAFFRKSHISNLK